MNCKGGPRLRRWASVSSGRPLRRKFFQGAKPPESVAQSGWVIPARKAASKLPHQRFLRGKGLWPPSNAKDYTPSEAALISREGGPGRARACRPCPGRRPCVHDFPSTARRLSPLAKRPAWTLKVKLLLLAAPRPLRPSMNLLQKRQTGIVHLKPRGPGSISPPTFFSCALGGGWLLVIYAKFFRESFRLEVPGLSGPNPGMPPRLLALR